MEGSAPSPRKRSRNTGQTVGWIFSVAITAALVVWAARWYAGEEKQPGNTHESGARLGVFVPDEAEEAYAQVVLALANPENVGDTPPVRVMRLAGTDELSEKDIQRLSGARDGAALYIGPEKFNDTWKEKLDAGQVTRDPAQFGHPDATYPGFARYTFEVPETRDYELWIRAFWVDDCGNSVDLSVDDGPLWSMNDSNVGRWTWRRLETPERTPRRFRLDAGRSHTVVLCNREDDCYLEQLMLRDADAGAPDPVDPRSKD